MEVFFVDYGIYNVIGVRELIDLENINQFISKIPYQVSLIYYILLNYIYIYIFPLKIKQCILVFTGPPMMYL